MANCTLLLSGGWTLFAQLADLPQGSVFAFAAGERGVRAARMLFAASLPPIGLSHLVYPQATAHFVPAWLPFRAGWARLTGAGQIASGLGVLFNVLPRVAAWAEAAQISIYTLLIWLPACFIFPLTCKLSLANRTGGCPLRAFSFPGSSPPQRGRSRRIFRRNLPPQKK